METQVPRSDRGVATSANCDIGAIALLLALLAGVPSPDCATAEEVQKSPKLITNRLGMEFVEVPAGEFIKGLPRHTPAERERHKVVISKPYYLAVTELTGSQYGHIMEAERAGSLPEVVPSYPKVGNSYSIASWNEANQIAETLSKLDPEYNYRLPTEVEWEYACRASRVVSDPGEGIVAVRQARDPSFTVKAAPPNAFGLYDMLRNNGEYCSDWYSPQKTARVARGVRSEGPGAMYTSWERYAAPPEGDSNILLGVRFVLEKKDEVNKEVEVTKE